MTKSKIATYAGMASKEAHEEYLNYTSGQLDYYYKDILSEMIDKFDYIEAMAKRKWYRKIFK